mgnify:CR=1 FL=1
MLTALNHSHFTLLESCPRKFRYVYLDRINTPVDVDTQTRQVWGSQLHMLMQQREMGLPIEVLLSEGGEFQNCVEALLESAPDLFHQDESVFRQSEYPLRFMFNGYLLTAVYDLLSVAPGMGKIIDWKTYLSPPPAAKLAEAWQTRLYLFLLVETTHFTPEEVSMSYCFVKHRDPNTGRLCPKQVSISYSTARHQQTRDDLRSLTDKLTQLIETSSKFPKVQTSRGICENCCFAYRCDRITQLPAADLPELTSVAEIAIDMPDL